MTQRSATAVSSFRDLSTTRMERPASLSRRDHRPDLPPHQGPEPFRRFVEDQELRVGHQRAADGEHLLLAAGERVGLLIAALRELREERDHPLLAPVAGCGRRPTRFSRTVSVGKQRRPSGTSPRPSHAARCEGSRARSWPAKAMLPSRCWHHAADGPDGRGLAHAVAAHERHDLAFVDRELDTEERLRRAIEGGDTRDLKQGRHWSLVPEIGAPHLCVGANLRSACRSR